MRKFYSFALALLLTMGFTQAQNKKNSRLAGPEQFQRQSYDAKFNQMMRPMDMAPTAKQIDGNFQKPVANPNGVNAVAPVELGRASNAFTILRPEQNQVFVDNGSNLVSFIHRQDVTIWGGGGTENGKFRYDISTDGGLTWNNDIGALQTLYTNYGRYPMMTGYNPSASTNPLDFGFSWVGPDNKFPTPGWIGYSIGWVGASTANPVSSSEHYLFNSDPTLLPGGLTTGLDGEFWTVDWQYDGSALTDSLYVMKGTYNSTTQDVDWVIEHVLFIPHDKSFDGSIAAVGPNIEFSPDGQTAWIGFLGDLTEAASPSGQDSAALAPCWIKSTDGGASWGAPMEMNMNDIPWVYDSLRTLWIDSTGNPASNGVATTAFDYDITVDANGNPHMGVVVGTGGDGYAISGLARFFADIYSTDGGTTWDMRYISPILTLRGEHGTDTGDGLLTMDNNCQVSRTESGDRVFYAWVDSDTTVIGFGQSANSAPNLRIASMRISDGYQTCVKLITDGDILWDGRALFPTMAPNAVVKGGGSNFHLPIVMLDMITNDQLQPCRFWYFGADAVIYDSDYKDPSTLQLAWGTSCTVVGNEAAAPASGVVLHQSFPNPNNGLATIRFELPYSQDVELDLVNMYGQQIGVLSAGNFAAGQHDVQVNTSDLAAGIYFYNLRAGDQVFTKKMIVTK